MTTTNNVRKDPTTKANLLDKMMSRDFSGDLADLAVNRDLRYERIRPNVIALKFGDSGNTFEMVVRKPRTPEALAAMRAKAAGKEIGKKASTKRTKAEVAEGTEVGVEPAAEIAKQPTRRRAPARAAAPQGDGARH